MPEKPERDDKATGKPAKGPDSITLPPIDATPEEIARALVREAAAEEADGR